MSQAMNISAGALQAFKQNRQAAASNIAQDKVTGAKGSYQALVAQVIGGQAQGVNVVTQNRISAQGAISGTGTQSHMAISGQGFFVVASDNTAAAGAGTSTSAYYFSRRGDFSITKSDQILRTITGDKLQGWKLDGQGNLPTDTSTLAGLVDISFANLSANATKTTKVAPVMNLSSSTKTLQGPGSTINLAAGNATTTVSKDDVIIPAGGIGGNVYGTLNYGDVFSLNLSGASATKFQLGGVALTHDITKSKMYGASDATTAFKVIAKNDTTTPVAGDSIKEGSGINIVSNGNTYTFTVTAASAQASTGQFNSLQGLASAINATKDLTATISDNRLYIASKKDSDSAVVFKPVGDWGQDLIDTLGLYDIAANDPKQAPNVNRFATLAELQKKISTIGGVSYSASLNSAGGLDFSATNASNSLTVRGFNNHTTQITKAQAGWKFTPTATMSTGTWALHRAVTITSNNHGLNVGDYVRITGSGSNALPAGIYQVADTGTNGDTFAIASVGDIVGVAFPTNGTFTWQRVDGPARDVTNSVIKGVVGSQCNTQGNANQAAFSGLGAYAASIGLKQDDVVYVTGSAAIKDGYYVVSANPGANNSLTVTIVGGAVGAGTDNKVVANNAIAEGTGLTITKIAGAAGAGLDTYSLSITATGADQTVTIKTKDANYQINDQIAFRNLAADAVTKNGVTITKDKYYTVTNKTGPDNNGNYSITFTAEGNNTGGGAKLLGLFGTANPDGTGLDNAAGTFLGPNAYIDNATQFFRALGITDPTVYSLPGGMDATYTPTKLNFASGTVTKNVNTQNVTVYDSLGAAHNLSIGFGKLQNHLGGGATWAVEIYDNTPNDIAGTNTLLASGRILFGADSSLQSVDSGLLTISPAWTNGAATDQKITFSWGSQGKTDGMTQNDGPTNLSRIDQDGQSVGSFIDYQISDKGIVTVQFSNGQTQDIYQIPLALPPNANGMTAVQNGRYIASNASGTLILKQMGVGGAGTVQAGALEDSTIDSAKEITNFIGAVQEAGLNSATFSKDSEAFRELLEAAKRA